jgi:hypothetical protein
MVEVVEENRAPQLLPLSFALVVLLWVFTTGAGHHNFVKEALGDAYDSQAEHFLRGDPGVDGEAILHEAMVVEGKVRMYFGPFPAFLRIPLNYIYPEGRGRWSRISGFCAGIIALAAFTGLLRTSLRSSHLSPLWRNWVGNACLVGFAFGSPLLLLLGGLSIYGEAIVWGLAWSLAAIYFACRSRNAEGSVLTRSLLAFSFCSGGALLSRVTFGAPLLLIAPLLALRLFRKDQIIRNLAALFLPLVTALLFHLLLSYARFGTFRGVSYEHYNNPTHREFVQKYGAFRLERVPYSFADYFILRRPELQHGPPFLKAGWHSYNYPSLYSLSFTETYSSLLWCSSWVMLGASMGVALLLRPGGANGLDRGIAAVLCVQVIGILSFHALAQRYTAEFYPFFVFALVFFLRTSRAALFHLRYLIIGLVAVSVVINSLATVAWLADADLNVRPETRAMWNAVLGRASPR